MVKSKNNKVASLEEAISRKFEEVCFSDQKDMGIPR